MKNKPAYSIDSVDHALRLVALLQQEGPLRVADAARRLGVAPSTAHRLLAMLVYRDFAEQDDTRRYAAGPALRHQTRAEPVGDLRRAALPHLQGLTAQIQETANLLIVVADQARIVATVECAQWLRVGDREGILLPAHLASGGLAALTQLPDEQVREIYSMPDSPVSDVPTLLRALSRIRRQGFALNKQATEVGLTAVGVPLRTPDGVPPGAISVAMPTARFRREAIPGWVDLMHRTAAGIERALIVEEPRYGWI